MTLPKRLSGARYLPASAFNAYVTILNPDAGQAADGTPNAATTVASNVHANVSPYRTKEVDRPQNRMGQSSFRIVIRYPQTFTVTTGMQINVRGQIHEIESLYDPDGQQVELHFWTWTNNAVAA